MIKCHSNSLIYHIFIHFQIRHILSNGSLYFPPFDVGALRQDIHWEIYKCVASNAIGKIISRDVSVKASMLFILYMKNHIVSTIN